MRVRDCLALTHFRIYKGDMFLVGMSHHNSPISADDPAPGHQTSAPHPTDAHRAQQSHLSRRPGTRAPYRLSSPHRHAQGTAAPSQQTTRHQGTRPALLTPPARTGHSSPSQQATRHHRGQTANGSQRYGSQNPRTLTTVPNTLKTQRLHTLHNPLTHC